MRGIATFFGVLAVLLGAADGHAQEVTVVSDVLGPEGPLFIDGNLYYVGWVSNGLYRWDGRTSTQLNNLAGCSHNGLAFTHQRTFLVACTADPGAIIETDMNGKQLRLWRADASGGPFAGGINDITVGPNGGAYATTFGPFDPNGPPTDVEGRLYYLAPGGKDWVVVADNLNYANGVGVSPDGKTLYVSQTVSNLILKFTVNPDGTLSRRTNFALLSLLVPDKVKSWWLGPDSMKVAANGDIYVAQWSGGKVLKLSADGRLLHVFEIAAGNGTTNVAFGPGEKEIYVTVAKDPNDPQARGRIVKIPNVP
jgi:gluconolactonase